MESYHHRHSHLHEKVYGNGILEIKGLSYVLHVHNNDICTLNAMLQFWTYKYWVWSNWSGLHI